MSKRITINVSDNINSKVEQLSAELGVNKSETLRRLIGVGLVILREERMGSKINTVDKDGNSIQIVFPDL